MTAPCAEVDESLLRHLRWRRDVRRFVSTPLPPGTVEVLVGIAGLAPSVGLSQPWRFVLVENPARRAEIRSVYRSCNAEALAAQPAQRAAAYAKLKLAGLDDAPCQLAVFVDESTDRGGGLGRQTMPETLAYSTVIAVHTFWLAARSIGVGVGWVSILDQAAVAQILDVPMSWKLVAYLCVGYPMREDLVPELEQEGWEARRPPALLHR